MFLLHSCSFSRLTYKHKVCNAYVCKVSFSLSFNVQLGANGYAFAINHNGFVAFHPGLRLIQV